MPDDITYMQNLKYDTKELIYKTEADTQKTNQWFLKGKFGSGEGIKQEFGMNRYTLYKTNNKGLLYSKGPPMQQTQDTWV